ncbi:hypothetical protein Zmor_002091 [Zophobas morio]|uniref:Uncharacterized protein n=1 Tax=Zophobas morio TaxID=2755281 RepID=A0AA38J6V9_9CUCU|nr:hypothetical protein Zmor_002091 [Zophobas morio]
METPNNKYLDSIKFSKSLKTRKVHSGLPKTNKIGSVSVRTIPYSKYKSANNGIVVLERAKRVLYPNKHARILRKLIFIACEQKYKEEGRKSTKNTPEAAFHPT